MNGQENLTAIADNFAIHLSLRSEKSPVIHGVNGVSQKSEGSGHASHYFSETRLRASGSLEADSRRYDVTGLAWMDHEFFTEQLGTDQVGWDWLSVQLEDKTELMLFQIRRKNGSIDSFSSGTFIDSPGRAQHLRGNDFQLEPAGETWRSPATNANYPIRWKIRVPSTRNHARCCDSLAFAGISRKLQTFSQLLGRRDLLDGMKNGVPLRGSGYLEMTGYDRPVQIQ